MIRKLILLTFLMKYSFTIQASQPSFSFSQKVTEVEVYDFVELIITGKAGQVDNPFTDVNIMGYFTGPAGNKDSIEGFCDEQYGKIYKVRYMPSSTGKYSFRIAVKCQGKTKYFKGNLNVLASGRKGPVRVDSEHPWHFIYEGTGEHYFWNSTTTYWMMGWKDEEIIKDAIERLSGYGINRIRVAMNGRQDDGSRWYEPLVKESEFFTFKLTPWVAERPDDLDDPEFDVTRFNMEHWQKLDRLVDFARQHNINVSLIFYVDGLDHGCDPFKKDKMGNEDEQRYYRYAAARYSGFENIMWDVTNEYHLFRSEAWVDKMGTLLKSLDPARHIISVHGHSEFPFRTAAWVDVVLYQSWDECGGYEFIRSCREKQAKTGRILPQVNEEYGYEEHYPTWGCGASGTKVPDGRSAENRIKLAWEMYMAGGYQTTGERANEGTGAGNDAGGGWINGRGNETMTMLNGYRIIMQTFQQTRYWEMEPHPELVNFGNMCLANPGKEYIVYSRLAYCRIELPEGKYSVIMIDPQTGEKWQLPDTVAKDGAWQYPKTLRQDYVFIIKNI